jgi:RimJ/RimL family protein N-acetyltransferase
MPTDLFHGNLVHLTVEEPEVQAASFSRWFRNTEFSRLLATAPEILWSSNKIKEWIEKDYEKEKPEGYFFTVRANQNDQLIGFFGLWDIEVNHLNSIIAIGIGEPEYWGKGYGSEAMQLALRYAFTELNLHRVSLFVFAYNKRAIQSYYKTGFRLEGIQRKAMLRDGERHDIVAMGILREEWEARQHER